MMEIPHWLFLVFNVWIWVQTVIVVVLAVYIRSLRQRLTPDRRPQTFQDIERRLRRIRSMSYGVVFLAAVTFGLAVFQLLTKH